MKHVVISSAGRTHPGHRAINADAILARDDLGLWAVADGMGGDGTGAWASATMIESLARLANQAIDQADALDRAVEEGNAEISAAARQCGRTIGSTVAALIFDGYRVRGVWVGNSRVYRLRDDSLQLMTHDHSIVQELVDRGALEFDEARTHSLANVLSSAVGIHARLNASAFGTVAEPGDMFLICSNGLSDMVGEAEMMQLLHAADPAAAADDLLRLALERGAPDNVSAVVINVAGANI